MQLLLQYLEDTGRYLVTQVWLVLNPNQPLSWKTLLSLCIFSWLLAFMTSDAQWTGALVDNPEAPNLPGSFLGLQMSFARWLLFTLGWIFLCLSMAWMLAKSCITLPFFGLSLYPAAWVVGLLSSTYIFLLGTGDIRMGAIVAWPSLSAIYTLLPKLITSKGKFQSPSPVVRQQFVMLLFASTTVSCWLQFCLLMQGWLQTYPPLALGPLEQSTLMTPIGVNPTVAQIAKATLDRTVQLLPQTQVEPWLEQVEQQSSSVNALFQSKLLSAQRSTAQAETTPSPDNSTPDVEGDGRANEETEPAVPAPMSAMWQLTLAKDELDAQTVRLQLRSRPTNPTIASGAYIEYRCHIQKYTASNNLSLGTVSNPGISNPGISDPAISSPVPSRPISQPVPSSETTSDPSPDASLSISPANSDRFDENPENYRQSTIDCEFMGLQIRIN